jgi:hypothetical protein
MENKERYKKREKVNNSQRINRKSFGGGKKWI